MPGGDFGSAGWLAAYEARKRRLQLRPAQEAAEQLGVPMTWFRDPSRRDSFHVVKVGKYLRVPSSVITGEAKNPELPHIAEEDWRRMGRFMLAPDEVAALLCVPVSWVHNKSAERNGLRFTRIGKYLRVSLEELEGWLGKNERTWVARSE